MNKLQDNYQRRKETFAAYTAAYAKHPEFFTTPRETADLDTAWLCYPVLINADAPFVRSELQEFIENAGIDTRTVWSGNVTRHPMMDGVEYRVPEGGLPHADAVFERGMTLGMSHGLTDAEVARIGEAIDAFASSRK